MALKFSPLIKRLKGLSPSKLKQRVKNSVGGFRKLVNRAFNRKKMRSKDTRKIMQGKEISRVGRIKDLEDEKNKLEVIKDKLADKVNTKNGEILQQQKTIISTRKQISVERQKTNRNVDEISRLKKQYDLERKELENKKEEGEKLKKELEDSKNKFKAVEQEQNARKRGTFVDDVLDNFTDEAKAGIEIHRGIPLVGRIYLFSYPDPKYRKTLPYWDALPIVIPIGYDGGRKFLGLNLHYLPIRLRAELFESLERFRKTASNGQSRKNMENEYFNLTYKMLNSLPDALYKPTIHSYIYKRIASEFAHIPLEIAEDLIYLPIEQYRSDTQTGVTKQKVWADSRRRIG